MLFQMRYYLFLETDYLSNANQTKSDDEILSNEILTIKFASTFETLIN